MDATGPAPVFVLGCPRSGTTLLRNLLNSHPNLSLPGESHFITRLYPVTGDPRSPQDAVRLARVIAGLQWVRRWRLDVDPARFADCRTFAEIVDRVFSSWAEREGKPRWGDKTPHYALGIPVLVELFPRAKVLHIVRDGRDVALSWIPMHFGPGNVVRAAREWRRFVSAARDAARTIPPETVLEVRYESLTTDPEATMRAVCEFIGEPFVPGVLTPTLSNRPVRRRIFGRSPASQALRREIVDGNTEKWRTAMDRRDRARFESVAGSLLAELGYPLEDHRYRICAAERLLWQAHDAVSWFVDRLNTDRKPAWLATEARMRWEELRSGLLHRFARD